MDAAEWLLNERKSQQWWQSTHSFCSRSSNITWRDLKTYKNPTKAQPLLLINQHIGTTWSNGHMTFKVTSLNSSRTAPWYHSVSARSAWQIYSNPEIKTTNFSQNPASSAKFWPTYSVVGTLFARDVEEDEIFSGNDVRDSVSVIGDGTKATAGADAIRVLAQVQFWGLAVRRLGSR